MSEATEATPAHPYPCALCSSPSTVISSMLLKPLCQSCQRQMMMELAHQFEKAVCGTCGKPGVRSVKSGVGYCGEHEQDEARAARLSMAGQGIVDAVSDAMLSSAEELGILLARVCEISVAFEQPLPDLIAGVTRQYETAKAFSAHKRTWIAGWWAYLEAKPKPDDNVGAHGYAACERIVTSGDREIAEKPGFAVSVYEESQRREGAG